MVAGALSLVLPNWEAVTTPSAAAATSTCTVHPRAVDHNPLLNQSAAPAIQQSTPVWETVGIDFPAANCTIEDAKSASVKAAEHFFVPSVHFPPRLSGVAAADISTDVAETVHCHRAQPQMHRAVTVAPPFCVLCRISLIPAKLLPE